MMVQAPSLKAVCLRSVLGLCIALSLSGCEDRTQIVTQRLNEIDRQPPKQPDPPPALPPVVTFNYAAQRLRSPFMPPSLAQELLVQAGKRIRPDLARPAQYLEQFALEELSMKGTIRNARGPLYALVQDPTGGIMRVAIGTYMGKNYGRVVGIAPGQISLIEIVPDGRDGYVERPRSLVMLDTAG